jgi:hypothetical protein
MGRLTVDWRLWVRFLSALALVLVAFAHRPLDLGANVPDASAYALPDGSVPVICVTLPAEKGDPHASHALPCDACLIAAAIAVPTPIEIGAAVLRPAERVAFASAQPVFVRPAFPPAAPPRAPPLA